ncbi:MAG: hypothetical protein ABIH63_04300 [archaeon]
MTLIQEKYGLHPTIKSYMQSGKETSVFSKEVTKSLLEISPSYNTYPTKGLKNYIAGPQPSLRFLENEDMSLLVESVRIAMSCEGSIFPEFSRDIVYPNLQFACSHPELLEEWQDLFQKVGIKSFILKSKMTWSGVKGLGIKELKSIKRFIEIGGFIEGVEITGKSKYYKGIYKNDLLKTLFNMRMKSFRFQKDYSNKTKNEIIGGIIKDEN